MEREMKLKEAVLIILAFLIFLYVGVIPEEIAFRETYNAFDPLVNEEIENSNLTLLGFIWNMIPLYFYFIGAIILISAFYVIYQSIRTNLDIR
jgi:hypothetical protein